MDIKMLKQQAEKYARKSKTARKPHIKAVWQKLYQDVMVDIANIERANNACSGRLHEHQPKTNAAGIIVCEICDAVL